MDGQPDPNSPPEGRPLPEEVQAFLSALAEHFETSGADFSAEAALDFLVEHIRNDSEEAGHNFSEGDEMITRERFGMVEGDTVEAYIENFSSMMRE